MWYHGSGTDRQRLQAVYCLHTVCSHYACHVSHLHQLLVPYCCLSCHTAAITWHSLLNVKHLGVDGWWVTTLIIKKTFVFWLFSYYFSFYFFNWKEILLSFVSVFFFLLFVLSSRILKTKQTQHVSVRSKLILWLIYVGTCIFLSFVFFSFLKWNGNCFHSLFIIIIVVVFKNSLLFFLIKNPFSPNSNDLKIAATGLGLI